MKIFKTLWEWLQKEVFTQIFTFYISCFKPNYSTESVQGSLSKVVQTRGSCVLHIYKFLCLFLDQVQQKISVVVKGWSTYLWGEAEGPGIVQPVEDITLAACNSSPCPGSLCSLYPWYFASPNLQPHLNPV